MKHFALFNKKIIANRKYKSPGSFPIDHFKMFIESSMRTYPLPHVKQPASGDVLYDPGPQSGLWQPTGGGMGWGEGDSATREGMT